MALTFVTYYIKHPNGTSKGPYTCYGDAYKRCYLMDSLGQIWQRNGDNGEWDIILNNNPKGNLETSDKRLEEGKRR